LVGKFLDRPIPFPQVPARPRCSLELSTGMGNFPHEPTASLSSGSLRRRIKTGFSSMGLGSSMTSFLLLDLGHRIFDLPLMRYPVRCYGCVCLISPRSLVVPALKLSVAKVGCLIQMDGTTDLLAKCRSARVAVDDLSNPLLPFTVHGGIL